MTTLLINNVEQSQPQDEAGTRIHLFGRSPTNPSERIEAIVSGFRPHFYARENIVNNIETALLEQDSVEEVEYGDYKSLQGDSLAKIYVPYPQDTRDARSLFDDTWEADVPFTRRFRIDTGLRAWVDVPTPSDGENVVKCHYTDIEPRASSEIQKTPTPEGVRTVFLDIEVDDRADGFPEMGEERILSIVAHDNFTGETKGFVDLDGRAIDDAFPEGAPEGVDELDVRPSEEQMLIAFRAWFSSKNPDLVSGWNSNDFDIPFIIKRMENLNKTNPNGLSPMGWSGISQRGDPRIKGVTCYDLLEVYKKNSFTELRSYSLDDVAEEELGSEKIQFTGGYYDLYQDNPERFIEYNAHDVTLCDEINQEAGVIEFRDVLRREVGVSFEDSYDNKDFVDMMCRRKLKERGVAGPTRPEYGNEADDDFDGAFVFDAYEGVAENVVGIDLASLYPMTMAMLNASPETKVDDGGITAANGQHFAAHGMDGVFKELVDEAISLKEEYKQLRDNAESNEEHERWAEKYNSAKTITNSLFGVTGWELFFLYDKDVAEAVTLTGQMVIKETSEFVESEGYEVIYGDTDSVYIKLPDEWDQEKCLNTAFDLCYELNEFVYPGLAEDIGLKPEDNLWEIETEAYMETFFQAGKKKRYAYLATWKDGREVENPEPSISGFASERSDTAELTVETEERIFNAIFSGEVDTVGTIVFEAAKEISKEGAPLGKIGIPGGMNKKVTDNPLKGGQENYYAVSSDGEHSYPQDAHPRGVWNTNQILDTAIDTNSKPRRIYIQPEFFEEVGRQIDVLAFEEPTDLDDIRGAFSLDVQRMTDTLLVNPLNELLSAIDVDANAAVRGQEQTGLGAFS